MSEAAGPGSLTKIVGKPNRIEGTRTFAGLSRAHWGRFEGIPLGEVFST
jgi:hypothetical protein